MHLSRDAPAAHALMAETWPARTAAARAAAAGRATGPRADLALRDGDAVVGAATLSALSTLSTGATCLLATSVCVAASRRGAGVGTTLMARLEAEASAQGAAQLLLSCQPDVRRFYARCGYQPTKPPAFSGAAAGALPEAAVGKLSALFAAKAEAASDDGAGTHWFRKDLPGSGGAEPPS